MSPENQGYVAGSKLVLILVAVTLTYFLVMLDTSIVATAIPQITTEFHSLSEVGWYGSAYQLASCSLQPLSGKLYTHFNIKWTYLAFFFVFQLGSVLCGAAQSSAMLTVGRAVAGLGSSGLMNGSLTIWTVSVPPARLPSLQGMLVSIGQLGVACGPLLGGALTQYTTWRWCFYLNLPVGAIVAGLLVLTRIPEGTEKAGCHALFSSETVRKLDLFGLAIFVPAAIMFFLALEFGGSRYEWGSAAVVALLCAAGAAFTAFLAWEHRKGDDAMIPFSLLRVRVQWCASLLMFGFLGMNFVVAYYLPIYLQAVKGDSPFMSGVHNLPIIISQVIMVLVGGFVVQRMGYYLPFVLCGTILASVGSGLLSTLQVSTGSRFWLGYQVVYGLGVGMVVQMPFIAIQTLTPRLRIPSALAILIFTQYFGAALFVTVAQSIFNNSMRRTLLQYAPGLDAEEIITGGAASVRSLATGKQLDGVLAAYAVSVDRVMYLAAALGAASFCFGWGLGWTDIRKVHRQNALEVEEENKVLEQKPAMDDLASGSGSTSNVERVG